MRSRISEILLRSIIDQFFFEMLKLSYPIKQAKYDEDGSEFYSRLLNG